MNPYVERIRSPIRGRAGSRRARVEIVPLIDVMFLLVAFFMVISISMVTQKGIFVDLSPAKTGDSSPQESEVLILSVNEAGEFFLGKEPVSEQQLAQRLESEARLDRNRTVVLNADRDARHEAVIDALDVVRRSRLHNIVFSVEPENE